MHVQCNCTSEGCGDHGGVEVDKRTFDNHARKDKIALMQMANERAEHAIQDQLDAIATHLSSTTLADDFPTPPPVPGGRLWSRHATSNTPRGGAEPESKSHQETIRNLLTQLAVIERQAMDLDVKLVAELDAFKKSPQYDSAFPVRHLKSQFYLIEADLSKIVSKAPLVVEMKAAVKEKIDKIGEKLCVAKEDWTRRQAGPGPQPDEPGIKVSTGMVFTSADPLLLICQFLDHFFRPILPAVDPILQLSIFIVIACQVILGTSREGSKFIFKTLQYLVQLCFMRGNPNLTTRDRKLLSDFPVDPRPTEKAFHLESETVIYAVCPDRACQAIYAPTIRDNSPIPTYPSRC